MAEQRHSYGLDWIDEDKLFDVTAHVFSGVIRKARSMREGALRTPPDPFTIVTQAVLSGQDAESMMAFEQLRGINKSISNAVGTWHQTVLGLADGWENLGSTGGVVDLFVRETPDAAPIAVEVKNRYNTIKSSDEAALWDRLDMLARSNKSKSYLVQIVPSPNDRERYDRLWKVSGRETKETVRCCDGATAYTWAFGKHDALSELYHAFPKLLSDVASISGFNDEGMERYFLMSMPTD